MQIKHTTFSTYGSEHEAVGLSWDDVEEVLGREHRGTPKDDAKLARALLDAGAPEWVANGEGETDSDGWYLLKPRTVDLSALSARITARGAKSCVPDNAGAVDAMIEIRGLTIGLVTLLPDPGCRGELSTWGSLDNWADTIMQRWIGEREKAGQERTEVIDAIVSAVRSAAN